MRVLLLIPCIAMATPASAQQVLPDRFCVVNQSPEAYFFVTETREGARQSGELEPGERLCATTAASDGVVNVFESAEALEGCGRLVAIGTAEGMRAYSDFDRCRWASHGE